MKKISGMKWGALLILFMGVLLLSACGLKSERTIKKDMKKLYPEAKLLKVVDGEDPDKLKKYTYTNKGVEFTVYDEMVRDSYFGFYSNYTYTDYWDYVCEKEKNNINQTILISGLTGTVEPNESGLEINIHLENIRDLETAGKLVDDLQVLFNEYLPAKININETGDQKDLLKGRVVVTYAAPGTDRDYSIFFSDKNFLVKDGNNWGTKRDYAEYFYEQAIIEERLQEDRLAMLQLVEHKPFHLTKLYINGEEYVSDRYEISFQYDAKMMKYMAPVSYGIQVEYNGGVDDYLQREIIMKYYPDSEYVITDSAKKTTYHIGKDQYEMKRDGSTQRVTFKKNQKNLDIAYMDYDYIGFGGATPRATYIGFIDLNDYAELMHMKVVKIDTDNLAVYLETID